MELIYYPDKEIIEFAIENETIPVYVRKENETIIHLFDEWKEVNFNVTKCYEIYKKYSNNLEMMNFMIENLKKNLVDYYYINILIIYYMIMIKTIYMRMYFHFSFHQWYKS